MTTLAGLGWNKAKKYIPAALTVLAFLSGLMRVLSVVAFPLARLVTECINFVIRRAFPDHLLLNYQGPGAPWQDDVRNAAQGLLVLVIGMFLGLWANLTADASKRS